MKLASGERRHLTSIADLVADGGRIAVERILETARGFEPILDREVKKVPALSGRTVLTVFFEASTRTSSSFELAAKRLSADTVGLKAAGSSADKGESLKDTILTLDAYAPDVICLRHPHAGAAAMATRYTDAHVVNAGDGKHQHPTQFLLDLHSIRAELGSTDGRTVAIVGDVLHSRVARSAIEGFRLMGLEVLLVGPPTLIPRGIEEAGVTVSHDIASLGEADVVYVLRMQHERIAPGSNFVPTLREYARRWGVTSDRVRPGQLVMHPGPMNRGIEISAELADAANSLILRQVRSGMTVRMAILYDLITRPHVGGARPAAAPPTGPAERIPVAV